MNNEDFLALVEVTKQYLQTEFTVPLKRDEKWLNFLKNSPLREYQSLYNSLLHKPRETWFAEDDATIGYMHLSTDNKWMFQTLLPAALLVAIGKGSYLMYENCVRDLLVDILCYRDFTSSLLNELTQSDFRAIKSALVIIHYHGDYTGPKVDFERAPWDTIDVLKFDL